MILAISYSLTLCWYCEMSENHNQHANFDLKSHFGLSNLSALLLFLLLELLEMHPSMIWCHIAGPAVSHLFQLIQQNTDGFPGQPRNIISLACPGSTLVPPFSRTYPVHIIQWVSRGHPSQMPEPPQLGPFDIEA